MKIWTSKLFGFNFGARPSLLDLQIMMAVLFVLALAGFRTPVRADDTVITSTTAVTAPATTVSTSTATELVSESQISAALNSIGTMASTSTATDIYLPYFGLTDVSGIIKKMRLGTEFDTKGRNWALAYMAIKTPVDDWTSDIASLSTGFAYRTNDKIGALNAGVVAHINTVVSKLSGGKYSIPNLDVPLGIQGVYQSAASAEIVGTLGVTYGF
jgi:hypothetical protein